MADTSSWEKYFEMQEDGKLIEIKKNGDWEEYEQIDSDLKKYVMRRKILPDYSYYKGNPNEDFHYEETKEGQEKRVKGPKPDQSYYSGESIEKIESKDPNSKEWHWQVAPGKTWIKVPGPGKKIDPKIY